MDRPHQQLGVSAILTLDADLLGSHHSRPACTSGGWGARRRPGPEAAGVNPGVCAQETAVQELWGLRTGRTRPGSGMRGGECLLATHMPSPPLNNRVQQIGTL